MNVKARLIIQEIGEELHDGQSLGGQLCPVCSGGGSGDRSLSVTRKGSLILYLCHRASCGASGAVATYGSPRGSSSGPRPKRVYVTKPDPLPPEVRELLQAKYYLTDLELARGELGWTTYYSPAGKGRVYAPLFTPQGKVRGYNCRDVYKEQTPKDLIFLFREDDCKLAWYLHSRQAPLVLVEDRLSALRLSSYVNAASLNGTDIGDAMVDEIRRTALGPIYLCLDKDATMKAVKQVIKLKGVLPMKSLPLSMDIKDMPREELSEWVTKSAGRG